MTSDAPTSVAAAHGFLADTSGVKPEQEKSPAPPPSLDNDQGTAAKKQQSQEGSTLEGRE